MLNRLIALAAVALAISFTAPSALAQSDEEGKPVELKIGNKVTHFNVKEWVNSPEIKRLDTSKVYAVDIWATAAPACKRTIPYLNTLYQELGPKGLVVVGLTEDKEDVIRDYMKDKLAFMTYPIATTNEASGGQAEMWNKFVKKSGLLPITFVINRAGQICYIGSSRDDKFEKILRLAITDRFDPELNEKAEPMLAAARRAAKVRNYVEAQRLYDDVVKLSTRHFTDIAMEKWRMISEQVLDEKAAKAYLRDIISKLASDEPSLIWLGNYLATNPEIKFRDFEASKLVADHLSKLGTKEAENLACIAAIQASTGDLTTAAETQYDAWLAAPGSQKARMKRSLDNYRAGIAQPGADSISNPIKRPDSDNKDTETKPTPPAGDGASPK